MLPLPRYTRNLSHLVDIRTYSVLENSVRGGKGTIKNNFFLIATSPDPRARAWSVALFRINLFNLMLLRNERQLTMLGVSAIRAREYYDCMAVVFHEEMFTEVPHKKEKQGPNICAQVKTYMLK